MMKLFLGEAFCMYGWLRDFVGKGRLIEHY